MSARGSNKRQRQHVLSARFNETEAATVRKIAASHGQSVGALLRLKLLEIEPPPRVRRSRVDDQAVAKLLTELSRHRAELNKVGSNLNQLTRYANLGRTLEASIEGVLDELVALFDRDLLEMRLACLQALGFEPDRTPPET